MTTTEKIDAALNAVLKASGYREPACAHIYNLDRMREAMRKIMAESYIEGGNDTHKAMKRAYHTTGNHPRLGRCNDE